MNELSAESYRGATTSFRDFVRAVAPETLPRGAADGSPLTSHGTTIVAATHVGGVAMAADRRATMGNIVAQRDIRKLFAADEYAILGIAGAAGISLELARLYQVELEHYEKLEGAPLSLDGKANRLGGLIRGNLDLALQGLAVVPVLGGFDLRTRVGRIFSYDATGGRYEETGFHSIGSGAAYARGALKKLYRPGLSESQACTALLQALVDSADDDAATAGPDVSRGIYPIVMTVDAGGVRELASAELDPLVASILAARRTRPDGPEAPLL